MYNIFIPIISSSNRKGLGLTSNNLEDVNKLNCSWFYNWNSNYTDNNYVPMIWRSTDPKLNRDYSNYLLMFNEPENVNQANLTPEKAGEIYNKYINIYPNAKMIVGGIGYGGYIHEWLDRFLPLLNKEPEGIHVHGYIEQNLTLEDIINFWTDIKNSFCVNKEFWITEFNDAKNNQFKELLKFIINSKWIDRYAVFANRLTGNESWWPQDWINPTEMQMINENNSLTERGLIYKENG